MSRVPTLQPWEVIKELNVLRKWYTVAEIRSRMESVHKWWEWPDAVTEMTKRAQ